MMWNEGMKWQMAPGTRRLSFFPWFLGIIMAVSATQWPAEPPQASAPSAKYNHAVATTALQPSARLSPFSKPFEWGLMRHASPSPGPSLLLSVSLSFSLSPRQPQCRRCLFWQNGIITLAVSAMGAATLYDSDLAPPPHRIQCRRGVDRAKFGCPLLLLSCSSRLRCPD